jgi:carbonic anhydrase
METLIEGYRRFRTGRWQEERLRFEVLAALGQAPRAMIVTCADSRVDPQLIFDTRPGELFVVRNVANLVPPYAPDAAYHGTSAALEFGVRVIGVADLVIMGHAQCGGIQALLGGHSPGAGSDFIGPWMQIAEPARQRVLPLDPAARQEACELEAIRLSLANLAGFPWVKEAVEAGRLRLHGCYFGIASGTLRRLGADGSFKPVEVAAGA